MRISLTLAQKGFILVLIPLLFQLVFVSILVYLLHQAEDEIRVANRAKDVIETTDRLIRRILTGAAMARQFSPGQIGDDLRQSNRMIADAQVDLDRLKKLVAGNPKEEILVERAEEIEKGALGLLVQARQAIRGGSIDEALDIFHGVHRKVEPTLNTLIKVVEELVAGEKQVEEAMPAIEAASRRNIELVLGFFVAVNCIIAFVLTSYFNRGTARRLNVLIDNTSRLAREEPLNEPLSGNDEISRLDQVFSDMALSLEAARHKERAIVENATDMICSVDAGGSFTAVNKASKQLLDLTPEALLGRKYIDLVVEDERAKTLEHVQQLKSGQTLPPLENRLRRGDGSIVDVLWSANWAKREQTLYCVMHNITERKEIEKMKQEFVAMVSHDLRTPLTSVQMCLALIAAGNFGEVDDEGKRFVAMADGNISRLIALVNDLLDIERMGAGKLDLDLQPTRLQDVVERTVGAIGAYASQQGIELVADVDDCEFIADGDRLVQVVVNLASNAVKFSPKKSRIVIKAGKEGDEIEVKVIDSGRGIPEELRQAIFDKFRQVERRDATAHGGTGLGLAICKAIVELHGGRIGVDSELNQGSTFWFRIPIGQVDNVCDELRDKIAGQAGEKTGDRAGSKMSGSVGRETGESVGSKTDDSVESKTGDRAGSKPSGIVGSEAGDSVASKTGYSGGKKAADEAADKTADGTNDERDDDTETVVPFWTVGRN